jgi:hypothetical protein
MLAWRNTPVNFCKKNKKNNNNDNHIATQTGTINLYYLLQNNKPSFNPVAAKMATKSLENCKILKKNFKFKGHNSCKNESITLKLQLLTTKQ